MFNTFTIQEPWFTLCKLRKKTIEGVINSEKFKNIKPNDNLIIFNHDKSDRFQIMITDVCYYTNFKEYLLQEGLKKTLPNVNSIEDGINIYKQYYNEQELKLDIIAIHFILV